MIGAQILNYRIVEKLGDGGMGSVYKAVDVMLEREVALKFLRPELAEQPDLVERFRSEAVVLARLTHQNVAGLYGLHRNGNDFFMAMEYVPGKTVEALLKQNGRLSVEHAAQVASHVLHALDYAHRHGVVHRDIKAANIIVTPGGNVKVMDFGIARVLGTERRTRVGFVVGTIGYMAPEQIQGLDVDGRTDLYAVGVVLYEMLTGRMPFQGDTEYAVMQAQVQQMPMPPRVFAEIPVAVETCVMRALAKQPADRFQTATEFNGMLQSAVRLGASVPSGSGSFARPADETREFKSDPALQIPSPGSRPPAPPPSAAVPAAPPYVPPASTPVPPSSSVPPAPRTMPPAPHTTPPAAQPPAWPTATPVPRSQASAPAPSATPPAAQAPASPPAYTPLPFTTYSPAPSLPPATASAPGAPQVPTYVPPAPTPPPVAPPPASLASPPAPAPDAYAPVPSASAPPPAPAPPARVAAPPRPGPTTRPARRLPASVVALVGVLAVAALGGGGFLAWQQWGRGSVEPQAQGVEATTVADGAPAAGATAADATATAANAGAGSAPATAEPTPAVTPPAAPAAGAPGAATTRPVPTAPRPRRGSDVPATPAVANVPATPAAAPVDPVPPPVAPEPQPLRPVLPPAMFGNVKWMRVEGTRIREVDVFMQVTDAEIRLMDRRTRATLASATYQQLSSAMYSQGKRPRWRPDLGPAPATTAFDDTVRTFHYVAFQGASQFLLTRVDRDDLTRLRDEIQKRSSLTIDLQQR